MRRRSGRVTAVAVAALAAALATGAHAADPLHPDSTLSLGLWGHDTPEVLKKAKADPYAAPAEPACQSLPAEIDALNAALGPDADQAPMKAHRVEKWVGGAVRGLIPHRDVIRFLTQANKKDDALRDAAMAGWARRGYLKGLAKTLDCTSSVVAAGDAAQPAAAVAPAPAETGLPRPILIDSPQPLRVGAPTQVADMPQN